MGCSKGTIMSRLFHARQQHAEAAASIWSIKPRRPIPTTRRRTRTVTASSPRGRDEAARFELMEHADGERSDVAELGRRCAARRSTRSTSSASSCAASSSSRPMTVPERGSPRCGGEIDEHELAAAGRDPRGLRARRRAVVRPLSRSHHHRRGLRRRGRRARARAAPSSRRRSIGGAIGGPINAQPWRIAPPRSSRSTRPGGTGTVFNLDDEDGEHDRDLGDARGYCGGHMNCRTLLACARWSRPRRSSRSPTTTPTAATSRSRVERQGAAIDAELKPLEKKLKKPPFVVVEHVPQAVGRHRSSLDKLKARDAQARAGRRLAPACAIGPTSKLELTVTIDGADGKRVLDNKQSVAVGDWAMWVAQREGRRPHPRADVQVAIIVANHGRPRAPADVV